MSEQGRLVLSYLHCSTRVLGTVAVKIAFTRGNHRKKKIEIQVYYFGNIIYRELFTVVHSSYPIPIEQASQPTMCQHACMRACVLCVCTLLGVLPMWVVVRK